MEVYVAIKNSDLDSNERQMEKLLRIVVYKAHLEAETKHH